MYTSREVQEEVPVDTQEEKSSVKVTKYDDEGNEVKEDDVEIKTEDESEPVEEDNTPKTKTITK